MSEVYVFRPWRGGLIPSPGLLPGAYVSRGGLDLRDGGSWLRYAGGLWLPDDGEYDLAFVNTDQPIALGVSLPVYDGIEWVWMDPQAAYAAAGAESSLVNSWHQQVGNPADGPGRHVEMAENDARPNGLAYRAAMDKCCQLHGCANGRGPSFMLDNPWMTAGLVRTVAGETVRPPESPVCYLCANDGAGHKLLYLKAWREDLQCKLDYSKERAQKLEGDLVDEQEEVERLSERLAAFESLMGWQQPVTA